jgi:hypothetical protein
MAVRTNNKAVAAAIAAIDDKAWVDIGYPPDGQAQVAGCMYKERRLIVRRTRLTDTRQAQLWPQLTPNTLGSVRPQDHNHHHSPPRRRHSPA